MQGPCINIEVLSDQNVSEDRSDVVLWILRLPAKTAAGALDEVGLEAAVAVHVAARHQGGLDHQLQADGAFEFGLI